MINGRIRKLERAYAERGTWLLLREKKIAELEQELERMQAIVRDREDIIRARENLVCLLEGKIADLRDPECQHLLRSEIEQRETTVREREARILSLEIEVEGRDAEIRLLRSALNQVRDVLRKRDGRMMLLEQAPSALAGAPKPNCESCSLVIDLAATLEEWRRMLPRFDDGSLGGDNQFINPYIVEKNLHGFPIRLLIATREGQEWYDKFDLTEAPFLEALRMVRPGDTVFDCGAHQGVHSILYSKMVGSAGQVVAFEPFPINLEIGRRNANLNNCTNIQFHGVAVSSGCGESVMSITEQCIKLDREVAIDIMPVRLAALDQFADLQPDFIKIDIEGAEIDALEGAQRILNKKPCLYVEMHPSLLPQFGKDIMDIFDFFDTGNYHCFVNYPGKEALVSYRRDFELVLPCALFFVPRDRDPLIRYYTL